MDLHLGWHTDLAVLRLAGSRIEQHADHVVVRTPTNPTYHWGNFVLVTDPEAVDDAERWVGVFERAFPEAAHRSIGLVSEPTDEQTWQAQGFEVEKDDVLATDSCPTPTPVPGGYLVRRLETAEDWDQSCGLRIVEFADEQGYEIEFERRSTEVRASMSERGHVAWFGAFHGDRLAAELGMSFLPVTEALLRLEFEGLLESRPRAGTRVRIPSPEDVEGNYVVRQALETEAAMLCSQIATPAERSELRRLAARVDALATKSDRSMYLTLHLKLHQRIAECARCDALRHAIEKTHALALIWFCAMRRPSVADRPLRNQDLVNAILSGEAARIPGAVREHLEVGRRHTLQVLEPYFRLHTAGTRRFSRVSRNVGS